MLWRTNESAIQYSSLVELYLNTVEPTVSGPKRPQDKILVKDFKKEFSEVLKKLHNREYVPIDKSEVIRWCGEGGSQPTNTIINAC